MSKSVQDRIIEIIAEQAVLDIEEVNLEATIEDLGLDSLGLVEMIFAIEESFDISVPYNANEPSESDFDISNVKAVIAGVEKLISEKDA